MFISSMHTVDGWTFAGFKRGEHKKWSGGAYYGSS